MTEITKTKLTLAQAAEQWEQAKRAIAAARPLLDEAAPVIVAHLEKTGRRSYKGRIALTLPPPRRILDQAAVREFLGPKVREFERTSTPRPSLALLDPDES